MSHYAKFTFIYSSVKYLRMWEVRKSVGLPMVCGVSMEHGGVNWR